MPQNEITDEISNLKEEKNAVLLAHNYQVPEIQLEADYLGDSLGLARKSAETEADVIVFAGVDFMAETAAMLNPDKKVLLPSSEAKCPMASMLPLERAKEAKEDNPDAAFVMYVNTLAEARAEADVTCTSANSVEIANALDEDRILFGPDKNIAWHVDRNTEKEIIPVPEEGHCYVHRKFTTEDVELLREEHPDAEVLAHPECTPDVQKISDYICSTSQMLEKAEESPEDEFIIATEIGLIQRLRREHPEKEFYPVLGEGICEQMKKHTLEKIRESLRDEKHVVEVPAEIAERARKSTERMLEISG